MWRRKRKPPLSVDRWNCLTFQRLTKRSEEFACVNDSECVRMWLIIITFYKNDGVFAGVFSYWGVACEDAGQAAYSQLRLHVTGEYNRQ